MLEAAAFRIQTLESSSVWCYYAEDFALLPLSDPQQIIFNLIARAGLDDRTGIRLCRGDRMNQGTSERLHTSLDAIIEQMAEGLLVFDGKITIIRANRKAQNLC